MTQWLEEKLCVLGLDSLKTRGPDGNFHIAIGGPGNEKAQLYDFSPTNEHPRRSRRIMLAFKKGTVLDNVFSQLSWNCWIETQVLLATMLHDITLKSTIHGKNMFGSLVPNHQRVAIPSYAWEHMKEKQTAKTNSCWSRQMKHLLFVLFCCLFRAAVGCFSLEAVSVGCQNFVWYLSYKACKTMFPKIMAWHFFEVCSLGSLESQWSHYDDLFHVSQIIMLSILGGSRNGKVTLL